MNEDPLANAVTTPRPTARPARKAEGALLEAGTDPGSTAGFARDRAEFA